MEADARLSCSFVWLEVLKQHLRCQVPNTYLGQCLICCPLPFPILMFRNEVFLCGVEKYRLTQMGMNRKQRIPLKKRRCPKQIPAPGCLAGLSVHVLWILVKWHFRSVEVYCCRTLKFGISIDGIVHAEERGRKTPFSHQLRKVPLCLPACPIW